MPLLFFALPVNAQEVVGVRVGPSVIEERVDPGDVFSDTLTMTNVSSKAQTFYVLVRDLRELTLEGQPIFAEEGEVTGFELSSWVRVTREPITLGAGETRTIQFSIAVPANASPGGHFGAIFLARTPEVVAESGAGFGFEVATIVNLRIAGEIREEAMLREFRTDKGLYGSPNVTFIARVENTGNVLVRPRGPLEIRDMFGEMVATLVMNEAGGAVLPRGIRRFEASWLGEGLRFGRHQVVMSLSYGEDGRQTITALLSFWIIPLRIVLPIFGGAFAAIALIMLFVRFHIRRKIREMSAAAEAGVHRSRFASFERELFHRRRAPLSRLTAVALALLAFSFVFLVTLLILFA